MAIAPEGSPTTWTPEERQEFYRKHGSIKFTLCEECDRAWSGYRECHCRTCHRHFSGLESFEAHLKTKRNGVEHVNPKAKAGFKLVQHPYGPIWGTGSDQKLKSPPPRPRKQDAKSTSEAA